MKVILIIMGLFITIVGAAQTSTSEVWINEFHYDEITTRGQGDSTEFVEVVIKNALANNATELAKYKLILYTSGALDNAGLTNGKGGLPYNTSSSWYSEQETVHTLSDYQKCPIANTDFTILYKKLPILQDIPAALALVYENTIVQLLSYEKSFKIAQGSNAGPAAGMTTTLINNRSSQPAMESSLTPKDHSISLLGSGTSYSNFQWEDGPTVVATPCALNSAGLLDNQTFAVALPVRWISLAATANRDAIEVQWKVATNDDVDRYELEFAPINGAFAKAGSVSAGSSTTGSYQSTINNVRAGTYKVRIRSVMVTGEVEYSETRVVRLGVNNNPVLTVYPNPVRSGRANVQIVPAERSSYTIQLLDVNGKVVTSRQTSMFEANSLNIVPLDLSRVSQGVYHVKIISAAEHHSAKIVVIR